MGPKEGLVGTITSQGGAAATILPIMGFMVLWIIRNQNLVLKDWLFIIGLILIGFVGAKRAIWFIMPSTIMLFLIFSDNKVNKIYYILLAFLGAPLIFYLGLRLSPTLNPDNKFWGRYDLDYTIKYVRQYSFGAEGQEDLSGRNSTTNFILNKFIQGSINKEDWLGYGLRFMHATTYDEFSELGFYTKNKGSASGVFQTLISNGFVGIISTLFFIVSMSWIIKNKKFRVLFILFFFWEYFYYTGSILREYSFAVLLVFVISFADTINNKFNLNYGDLCIKSSSSASQRTKRLIV